MPTHPKAFLAAGVVALLGAFIVAQGLAAQGPSVLLGSHAPTYSSSSVMSPQAAATDRNEGTATILSIVIPGAGQMYAGDISRGLLMLVGSYGATITGGVIWLMSDPYEPVPIAGVAGLVIGVGVWVWGIVDAAPTTRRMNTRRRMAVVGPGSILVNHENAQTQIGVRVSF